MGKVINHYYQAAKRLGLATRHLPHIDGIEIRIGQAVYYFRGGDTPFNCGSAISVANNKYCMNRVLSKHGFPVPKATGITKGEFTKNKYSLTEIPYPVVVKPTHDTACGKDVICNVKDESALQKLLQKGFKSHDCLSIEEFKGGLKAYRVLVFMGKVIGVVERTPAHIVGDGKHTLKELIEIVNKKRDKLKETISLGPIKIDDEFLIKFKEMGITPKYIPKKNEYVELCYNCNSTRGGTMKSLGDQICHENADLLVQAAKALTLNLVGFDVLCEDINKPISQTKGYIIEANHNPDISIHENPLSGKKHYVTNILVAELIKRHPFIRLKRYFKKANINKALYKKAGAVVLGVLVLKIGLSLIS